MKEIVKSEQIMEPVKGQAGAVRMMRRERLAGGLAWVLLGMMTLFTLLILTYWIIETKQHPDQADKVLDRAIRMFEAVVTKTLWALIVPLVYILLGQRLNEGDHSNKIE